MKRSLSSLLLATLAGCSAGQDRAAAVATGPPTRAAAAQSAADAPGPPTSVVAEPAADAATSPVRVYWSHSPNIAPEISPVALELTVEAVPTWRVPVAVTVRVPDGARIEAGDTQAQLSLEDGAATLQWQLAFEQVPAADFVVVVDARQEGFGFHAEPRFTFGRAEAATPALPRVQRDVRVGAVPLGDPIDMSAGSGE
ncbi:MAG: hypothetical protein H6697_10070 [Myxococcales bacterium]|nr:hypothetical protein [Myxococcales bacterium]MCB9520736.1 hypothetical protein [Myxococcales bacterium]